MDQTVCPWRMSVAPMMDWTDRHCRFFHRLLTPPRLLYTEMVTTGALVHGDVPRHLRFNDEEHPVALQLGGSDPADLAHCAKLGEEWGYDEINLNCGCPCERVQRGAFGACLMAEPQLVADCVKAMRDAVDVRSRSSTASASTRSRATTSCATSSAPSSEAGCDIFIVHARNAWLKGLSPKENREIPPLRYELVHRLKRDFPELTISSTAASRPTRQMHEHLRLLDGVMVGREAYHNPWWLAHWDARFYGEAAASSRARSSERMCDYMEREAGTARPGEHRAAHAGPAQRPAGARRWRQVWSDHRLKG